MKPISIDSKVLLWLALALVTTTAITSLVWAFDKHYYAKQLEQLVDEQQQHMAQQHQRLLELNEENYALREKLALFERQVQPFDEVKTSQAQTLLGQGDSGLILIEKPHGDQLITSQP